MSEKITRSQRKQLRDHRETIRLGKPFDFPEHVEAARLGATPSEEIGIIDAHFNEQYQEAAGALIEANEAESDWQSKSATHRERRAAIDKSKKPKLAKAIGRRILRAQIAKHGYDSAPGAVRPAFEDWKAADKKSTAFYKEHKNTLHGLALEDAAKHGVEIKRSPTAEADEAAWYDARRQEELDRRAKRAVEDREIRARAEAHNAALAASEEKWIADRLATRQAEKTLAASEASQSTPQNHG